MHLCFAAVVHVSMLSDVVSVFYIILWPVRPDCLDCVLSLLIVLPLSLVHMDLAWGPHLESFPLLASSGAFGRSGRVSGMCPRPIKALIDRTMISAHFGLQRVSGLIWGPGPVWACFWPVCSCPCLVSNLLSMPCVYLFYFRSAFISGFMPLDRIGLS